MNAKVSTTTTTQKANELLGTQDKTNYFLIIETKLGKHVIQIGKSTKDHIDKLKDNHTDKEELEKDEAEINHHKETHQPKKRK